MAARTTTGQTRHPPSDPNHAFCHQPTLMTARTTTGQTRHPPSDPNHAFCHQPTLMTARTTTGQARHTPLDLNHAFCHQPTLMTSRTTTGHTAGAWPGDAEVKGIAARNTGAAGSRLEFNRTDAIELATGPGAMWPGLFTVRCAFFDMGFTLKDAIEFHSRLCAV
jgi:hypothetical protein